MDLDNLNLAVLYGSTREGRLCDTVVRWVVGKLRRHGDVRVDVLDPLEFDLPPRLNGSDTDAVTDLRKRVGLADAIVVVTPEYNHGYPAALKLAIDSVYSEWQAKPVGFVSYGGIAGGLRAVEQLRLVFAELHATTIRDCVSFANAWDLFGEDGRLNDERGSQAALDVMIQSLKWWARVLRDGRRSVPYVTTRAA